MKHFFTLALLVLLSAAGYAAPFSVGLDTRTVAANGQYVPSDREWMAGLEKPLLQILYAGKEAVYLGPDFLYNASRDRFALGASLGAPVGNLGAGIAALLDGNQSSSGLLSSLVDYSNFLTVELGAGYRLMPLAQGEHRLFWSVGGQVRVPLF